MNYSLPELLDVVQSDSCSVSREQAAFPQALAARFQVAAVGLPVETALAAIPAVGCLRGDQPVDAILTETYYLTNNIIGIAVSGQINCQLSSIVLIITGSG